MSLNLGSRSLTLGWPIKLTLAMNSKTYLGHQSLLVSFFYSCAHLFLTNNMNYTGKNFPTVISFISLVHISGLYVKIESVDSLSLKTKHAFISS